MGQYKVPQDVEAEDKILGPLTFRQFIYALIGAGWAILSFALFRSIPALMFIVGLPVTSLFLLLAFFRRDGQNFEQILLAMIGFFSAARKRLWVKENVIETFHVEPKKVKAEVTQRNPVAVLSELERLSTLIDSRGWNKQIAPETAHYQPTTTHEERIVAPQASPHPLDEPKTDMLDLKTSPLAQNLSELLNAAAADVRQEAVTQMSAPSAPPAPVAAPPVAPAPAPISTSGVTAAPTGDILKLATQNDDLTVSQIAAQATRIVPLPEGQTVDLRSNGS